MSTSNDTLPVHVKQHVKPPEPRKGARRPVPQPPPYLKPIIQWLQAGVPIERIAMAVGYTLGTGEPLRLLDRGLTSGLVRMLNESAPN